MTLIHRLTSDHPETPVTHLSFGQNLERFGFPELVVDEPVLRTLGTSWLRDTRRSILFTTDSFCADLMTAPGQAPFRTNVEDTPPDAHLKANVLAKFDWIADARQDELAGAWDRYFAARSFEVIAPIHGRALVGQAARDAPGSYRRAIFGET